MRQKISVLITDLDNTLDDWVGIWYASFSPMLEMLMKQSELPRDTLIKEIKAVHQRHKTSEYAFVIEEIPSLITKHPGEDLAVVYADAIRAYREGRARALKLYPGVAST